uniref:Uncharacterized protein n=1 Tax=Nymphaea colorata TaxID=210225 RepID=A0A5K0ZHK7_9MAGN
MSSSSEEKGLVDTFYASLASLISSGNLFKWPQDSNYKFIINLIIRSQYAFFSFGFPDEEISGQAGRQLIEDSIRVIRYGLRKVDLFNWLGGATERTVKNGRLWSLDQISGNPACRFSNEHPTR